MNLMNLNQKQLELIKNCLIEKLAVYLIIIFGSYAKATDLEDSDLDIAFLSAKKFATYDIFMISQQLAEKLQREVDLVDLTQASTVFQMQILSTGQVVYNADEKKRVLFNMLTYKKYAKLSEERQKILDKIQESGSVYGPGCGAQQGAGN